MEYKARMPEAKDKKTFLCSSAEWMQVVEDATSFEEAASIALQAQIDSDSQSFSVGVVISVVPIKIMTDEMKLIYAPSVLADIGMHKHATEMIKQIDKDDTKD